MDERTRRALWQLSAGELAAAYRAGTTTPEAVLEATFDRLADINPKVNALVALDPDLARQSARDSTRRWHERRPLGPCDGIPITIKDNILVKGLRATWGSRLYADHVAPHDEEPVARLRAGGAVILGKTNVPEFTVHGYTDNSLFGPTRNPWNTELTPGGSSGGAAAAVACGIGAIALATDGGGSIRRPAALTGLVGFKPSRGAVPRGEGFPVILHNFEVVGPLARCVDDIALVMQVIGGPRRGQPGAEQQVRPLRILHAATFAGAPVDPAIASAVSDAAEALRQAGHEVEHDLSFGLARALDDIWPVISATGVAWLLYQHADGRHRAGPAVAEMARAGEAYSARDYLRALDTIRKVKRDFDDLFARIDILLTPASAAMPWPACEIYPPVIAGQPVGPRGHAVFTPFANALGLPAISLPCRLWPDGMPVGLQFCAARGCDSMLLGLARDYERNAGLAFRWPPL